MSGWAVRRMKNWFSSLVSAKTIAEVGATVISKLGSKQGSPSGADSPDLKKRNHDCIGSNHCDTEREYIRNLLNIWTSGEAQNIKESVDHGSIIH